MGKVHRFFRTPVLWVMRLGRVMRAHWLRSTAVLSLLLVGGIVAAEVWTPVLWGNVGEWVAGVGALFAVIVALWSQALNHAREEGYRREDRERWDAERAEERRRWDTERDDRTRRDLSERAERAYRELVVTTELNRLERVVEFDISVTNEGPFPYRDLRAEYKDGTMNATFGAFTSSRSDAAAEVKPNETQVLCVKLTPELPDNWPQEFKIFFADQYGNEFVYTNDNGSVQVTPR